MSAKMTKNQRGDTIVEVLIAMAVAASVLAITYATMNRNLLTTQNTQERVQAAKLAQGQLEMLRYLKTNNPGSIAGLSATDYFCMLPDGTASSPAFGSPLATPAACTSNFYHVSIVNALGDHLNYKVTIIWDKINGSGQDNLTMFYRK